MSVLIGMRIELRDAQGELAGALYLQDAFEAVAVPQRGDLVALTAIAGPLIGNSGLAAIQAVQALADAFPVPNQSVLVNHFVRRAPKSECRRVTRS